METQKIKAMLSAAKHRSLSKAAAEVSYTPSAMSHIADAIERELGVKILVRTPLGVTLTEEGEALYDRMVALVEAERELVQAARTLAQDCLCIGARTRVSLGMLYEIVDGFRAAHPGIRISMAVEDDLQLGLENEQVDVVFTDEPTVEHNKWLPVGEDQENRIVGFAFRSGGVRTSAVRAFADYLKTIV